MDRRSFVRFAACGSFAAPLVVRAQARSYRIGFLASTDPATAPNVTGALRDGLRERGYVEGRNLVFEFRWSDGPPERLAELAAELVRGRVDLVYAWATPATLAARKATSTVPIVFVGVADPAGSDLVASLAHPGGNVTGVSNIARDLSAKLVELLVQFVPDLKRFAVLRNAANPSTTPQLQAMEAAARGLGLQAQSVDVRTPAGLDAAFAAMVRERAQGVVVIPDPMFVGERRRIAELAATHRLPAVFARRESVEAGGLASYGSSLRDQVVLSAAYVDRIFKGAKPADLPIEQPTRLELVVNETTAKALGLKIPAAVLARDPEIIR